MVKKALNWLSGTGPCSLLLVGGIVAGIIIWGGFNTFMEYTNTYEGLYAIIHQLTVSIKNG